MAESTERAFKFHVAKARAFLVKDDMGGGDLSGGGLKGPDQGTHRPKPPNHGGKNPLTAKGNKRASFQGIDIVIDRPKGFVQEGKAADGTPWKREYKTDYGFVPGTKGGDGEGLDVFLGSHPQSKDAHWILQRKDDGSFDEYKLMLGFPDTASAKAMYLAHVPKRFFGGMSSMSVDMVKALLGVEPVGVDKALNEMSDALVSAADSMLEYLADGELSEKGTGERNGNPLDGNHRPGDSGADLGGIMGSTERPAQSYWLDNGERDTESLLVDKMLRHESDGWNVYSEDGAKHLGGPYERKDQAVARLRQVEGHKKEARLKALVAKRRSTASLLVEAGPPDEWSGGVASALGARRKDVEALWESLTPAAKDVVRAAWEKMFDSHDVIDDLHDVIDDLEREHGDLAKSFERVVPFAKAALDATEVEQRYALGIVLEPETVDSQGDIYSHDEIRKAAWHYMSHFQNVGLMHKGLVNGRVRIVESFIAPVDFELAGSVIKAGTWLMGLYVPDDELWGQVKSGELSGLSIGGWARKEPERGAA